MLSVRGQGGNNPVENDHDPIANGFRKNLIEILGLEIVKTTRRSSSMTRRSVSSESSKSQEDRLKLTVSLMRHLSSGRSPRPPGQSQDAEDEGSFEFACEIASRIVSTRVNKFLMNMYKWLLWLPCMPTGNRGAGEI